MEKIKELRKKKSAIIEGPGPDEKKKVFFDKAMLPPRERIDRLLDEGTFNELDMLATNHYREFGMDKREIPAECVITGLERGRTEATI